MPIKGDREYRSISLLMPTAAVNKRFESDYYVEGFATTFNKPYLLYEDGDIQYYEVVDRHALDGADLTDVIMQRDHYGRVFARNKMGAGKKPTLIVEPQDVGFFVAADLATTEQSRQMYEEIDTGLIYQMSWAFTVLKDSVERSAKIITRTIWNVKKVFDVSGVSLPASPDTEISARSWIDGVIETEKRETEARKRDLELAKSKYFYYFGGTK